MKHIEQPDHVDASLAVGACVTLAACASGQSILHAGNDAHDDDEPPTATTSRRRCRAADDDLPRPAVRRRRRRRRAGCRRRSSWSRRPRIGGGPTGLRSGAGRHGASWPATPTSPPARSTPSTSATEPVHITFWHAMQSAQGDALAALTDQYNASQDRVVVELQNQNGYEELIDKYFQSSTEDRPARRADARVHAPADGRHQLGDHRRRRASRPSGYDISPFLPRAMFAYQTGGVQWAMPFNISSPVLYYNKAMFEEAGLDPDDPPITLDELRDVLAADRRLRGGDVRHRPRLRRQLRRRLVPRAVVRPSRAALRRQRQRPHGTGDAGAVRHARGGRAC